MMASHPQATVVPEVEPKAISEQGPQVPLGVTNGNRNVSPSSASVSSAEEGSGAGRKRRRTGAKVNVRPTPLQAPRWAASLLSSRPSSSSLPAAPSSSASKPRDVVTLEPELPLLPAPSQVGNLPIESPEPVRIVSDIVPEGLDNAVPLKLEKEPAAAEVLKQLPLADDMSAKKPTMAQSAKIQQLQQAWEESNSSIANLRTANAATGSSDQSPGSKDWLGGRTRDSPTSGSQTPRKHSLPEASQNDPKRRLTETRRSVSTRSSSASNLQAPTTTEDPEASASSVNPGFIRIDRMAQPVASSDDSDYEMPDVDSKPSDEDDETDEDDSSEEVQRPAVPAMPAKPPGAGRPFQELTTIADGSRRYDHYPSALGTLEPTHGALLPGQYVLWEDTMRPWICPLRHCRTVFAKLSALGMHFKFKHKNLAANDNLDGTLTQVPDLSIEGPAIVVSRGPMPGGTQPLADPNLPGYKPTSGQNVYMLKAPWKRTSTRASLNLPSDAGKDLEDVFDSVQPTPHQNLSEYVKAYLSPAYRMPAERPDFKALLKLPIKRAFPPEWTSKHKGVGSLAPQAALSLLVFLTGDVSATPCAVCTDPLTPENLLRPCIVLHASAPSWLQETVPVSCASCQWRTHYKRWKNTCNLTQQSTRTAHTAIRPPLTNIAPAPQIPAVVTPIPPPLFPYAHTPRHDPAPITRPSPAVHVPKPPTPVPVPKFGPQAHASNARPSSPPTRRVTRHSLQAAEARASTPASPSMVGNEMPADMLEMEDWEVAPGRVRDERSASPTNVAFSNAYLTTNQAVSVSENIAFNVIVIKPGGSHRWSEDDDKVRICSLAGGKLSVKLDKTEHFLIGPNGMFKVKPGVACSVENRMYMDAVIHVTSVAQY